MKKGLIIGAAVLLLLGAGSTSKKDSEKTKVTVSPKPTVAAAQEPSRSMPAAVELIETPELTPTPEPTPTPRVEYTYIVNKNTGVVHRESCRFVKQMKDSSKKEITCTQEELHEMGYNLCDTCNP